MEIIEKHLDRLKDPEFKRKVMDHLLDIMIEHMTHPANSFLYDDPSSIIDKIRTGQKIDELTLIGPLVVAGQDLRLSPDEIDQLKELIFKNPPKRLADK